ncbi:MAG TPA: hypothetical protein VFM18_00905 [Methanosarcina sp.]|nr:hypothetical protein [Methanosarcina sp.]
MDYQLDTKAANQADVIFSKIEQSGKYLGVLTRAEPTKSDKGTKGVDLSFKANSGETADYLTLWTHNAEGKQLMGFNTLMAIMTCLRVKTLTAEKASIEKYDKDQQKRVKVEVPLFLELMNKPIGLLLHMEEYAKNAGGTAWKPVISAAFDKDEFTASEILSQAKKPETLAKMVLALRDKPLKGSTSTQRVESENPAAGFQDFDESIPF